MTCIYQRFVEDGTAYHALVDLAHARAGEKVLVLGASGGVGMAAIDICNALGLDVVAAASSPAKLAACEEAGARTLIDYSKQDFKAALQEVMLMVLSLLCEMHRVEKHFLLRLRTLAVEIVLW